PQCAKGDNREATPNCYGARQEKGRNTRKKRGSRAMWFLKGRDLEREKLLLQEFGTELEIVFEPKPTNCQFREECSGDRFLRPKRSFFGRARKLPDPRVKLVVKPKDTAAVAHLHRHPTSAAKGGEGLLLTPRSAHLSATNTRPLPGLVSPCPQQNPPHYSPGVERTNPPLSFLLCLKNSASCSILPTPSHR
ncbi:hypothetical protein ASPFODRAFT_719313, partial [Aspergillus luchuensis CBS 106.47]